MIDLDLTAGEIVDEGSGGVASGREGRTAGVSAGAFKRRGLPSEDAQEKAVVFEAREGGTLEDDDKVKHYDADGMSASLSCLLDICANMVSSLFSRHISADEGSCIRWHRHTFRCTRACVVRGARMGSLKPLTSRISTWNDN
jgi:hypothetical protein